MSKALGVNGDFSNWGDVTAGCQNDISEVCATLLYEYICESLDTWHVDYNLYLGASLWADIYSEEADE